MPSGLCCGKGTVIKATRRPPDRAPAPASAEVGARTSPWSIRGAIVLRLALAVAVAAVLTAGLYRLFPAHLSSSYGVIGFPNFANFDIEELLRAYQLVVIVFPVLVVASYGGAWLLSRPVGLPVERLFVSRWTTRRDREVDYRSWLPAAAICVPALIIGAVIGLEIAIWQGRTTRPLLVEVAAFSLAYLGASVVAGRALAAVGVAKDWASGIHLVDIAVAPLTIVLASLVSATTEVTISTTGQSDTYAWFPAWISVPLACGVEIAAWSRVRRAQWDTGLRRAAQAVVALVAVPVALFLLAARVPGPLGPMNVFEEGQVLAAGRLVDQGYRYWVDLVSIHGLFGDVWSGQLGFALFGFTRWGAWASQTALLTPLASLSVYYLFAYLLWRRWYWLLLVVLLMLSYELAPVNAGFLGWPIPFLLLGLTLKTRRGLFAAAAAVAAIAYSLVVPELTYVIPGLAVGVVLADLQGWRRQSSVVRNLRLSWFALGGAVAALVLLAIGLVATGSLNAFVQYYLDFVPGHEASGGFPLPFGGYSTVGTSYLLQLTISIAGLVAVILYFGHMIYRGERPSDRDVVVGALAVVAFSYFPQFVSRADAQHLVFSYLVVLPVALYLAVRAFSSIEHAPKWHLVQGAKWVAIAVLAVIAVSQTPAAIQQVRATADAGSHFRQVVNLPPANSEMGYESPSPSETDQLAADLQPVVSRYVGKDQWLFDFTNSPGLFYYLLNIHPRTRFYNVQLAYTAAAQQTLVDQLRQYQPSVVAFNDQIVGFPSWDYISNDVREYLVSRYVLANYEPLTEVDSFAFFIRKDAPAPPPPADGFRSPLWPQVQNPSALYWGPECSWGSALNYLTYDQPSARSQRLPATVDGSTDVTAVEGWAFDTTTALGASQVMAVQGGRVVATANADLRRPGGWSLWGDSGSRFAAFSLPVSGGAPVSVIALNARGEATALDGTAPLPAGSDVPGTSYPLSGHSVVGAVTGTTRMSEQTIRPPQTRDWARYRWLGVRLGLRRSLEHVTVSDGDSVQPLGTNPYLGGSHVITFDALPGPARTFYVPVASCPQWFGYGSAPLTVTADAGSGYPALTLIS